jgi:DNA-binding response OmpR family regulator
MPRRFQGRTILLLEDEPFIALAIEQDLAEVGATVLSAATCSQALWLLLHERIDVAVLDFRIGDENCEAVAQRCRELGVPFVITSGLTSDGDTLGASEWLDKPFPIEQLLDCLSEILPQL